MIEQNTAEPTGPRGLRIAVLAKQVPRGDQLELGPDGRLARTGPAELNPHCRRAIAAGVDLARKVNGSCDVITMGPPGASDCLREAVAWGASGAVLLTDPALAGSDSLATAQALFALLLRVGPFDLVLAGRNSVDSDTGQVAPQLAELLGWPLLNAAREMTLADDVIQTLCEYDDGWVRAHTQLPAVVTCAERLCAPAKVDQKTWEKIPGTAIRQLSTADLGPGSWGEAGSPTRVGVVKVVAAPRVARTLRGPLEVQLREVARVLEAACAPDLDPAECLSPAGVPDDWVRGRSIIGVVCEKGRESVTRELLGGAAGLARQIGGRVAALDAADSDGAVLSAQGADIVVQLAGQAPAEDVATAVGQWGASRLPWAIILPGTLWGREVAGRAAVCLEAGLTGDVIELEVSDGRLVAWKPAFGGQLVAAINTSSTIQMATVRPGAFATLAPRAPGNIEVQLMPVPARSRVIISEQQREDDIQALLSATAVVGVGSAIEPQRYAELDPLLGALGAQLAATRRVTDKGWLPHARQVGLTGYSIAPRVYLAIGISGSSNHMIGVRRAGTIVAINSDPDAPITRIADMTVVADWGDVVPLLVNLLPKRV